MKITIVTSGSRGDVQPYIALGIGLKNAGHQVSIVTHQPFADFIRSYGLEILPLNGDPQEILASEKGKSMLEHGSNPLRSLAQFMELYKSYLDDFLKSLWEVCQDSDAIIFSITTFPCYYIAEKLKIPSVAAYLQPFTRTKSFPSIFLPPHFKLGRTGNLLSHTMIEQMLWQSVRPVINKWISKTLSLQPLPVMGAYKKLLNQKYPILYGFSPVVVPRPEGWGNWIHITGYWFLDQHPDWQPSKELLDFLDAGKPPVYIGFGSMVNRDPEEAAELAIKALKQAKMRGILLSGWGGMQNTALADHIFQIDSVPHDWLFPQMAAVVHHGGAGTTAAGLRAGIPSVAVPFFAEQPFWANRIYQLGAGPKPIPRKKLTADNLSEAIKIAVNDPGIQTHSSRIGQWIRSEDGIANAVRIINQLIEKKSATIISS